MWSVLVYIRMQLGSYRALTLELALPSHLSLLVLTSTALIELTPLPARAAQSPG